MREENKEFQIDSLDVEIHCPKCGNELVHDGNSLPLAESEKGAMFECGECEEISQWEYTLEPFMLKQVPVTLGGSV